MLLAQRPSDRFLIMILLKCPACGTELVVGFSKPAEEMHCPECSASFIVGDSFVAIHDRRVVPDFGADYLTVGLYHYLHRRAEADKSIQELDDVLRPHGIVYGLDGSRCY
jgi:ribosomal protein S27E